MIATHGQPRKRKKSQNGLQEARHRIGVAARDKDEELDLGGLGLTDIPEELFALTQLKVLYLGVPKHVHPLRFVERTARHRKMCNALEAIPPALFTSLLHLQSLHLDQNHLGNLPAEIAALTRLTSLDLSGNDIGDDGAQALAALTGLTALGLWHNRIGDDGARALAALTGLLPQSVS